MTDDKLRVSITKSMQDLNVSKVGGLVQGCSTKGILPKPSNASFEADNRSTDHKVNKGELRSYKGGGGNQ